MGISVMLNLRNQLILVTSLLRIVFDIWFLRRAVAVYSIARNSQRYSPFRDATQRIAAVLLLFAVSPPVLSTQTCSSAMVLVLAPSSLFG